MQEAEFKAKTIREWERDIEIDKVYCIETEETEPGFPDVMVRYTYDGSYSFFEFKVSDHNGRIKFKRSQPSFYKRNRKMNVCIVALDNRNGETIIFPSDALFRGGRYTLNDKLEVQL